MRSQLTRRVFRRLLSNEGLIFECPNRAYHLSSHRPRRHGAPTIYAATSCSQQRRTIFGFSRKPPRQPKEPELEPGLKKMLDLSLMESIHARPPDKEDLLKAWKAFFAYKLKTRQAVNNTQAAHALRTLRFLKSHGLGEREQYNALRALKIVPDDDTEIFLELAEELYHEAKTIDGSSRIWSSILSMVGRTTEARTLLEGSGTTFDNEDPTRSSYKLLRSWHRILLGFKEENNETELLNTIQIMDRMNIRYSAKALEIVTAFYISRNQMDAAKMWYEKVTQHSDGPGPTMLKRILHACIKNNELDWCKTVFRGLMDANPTKPVWDVMLQWAAGTMGKGVEDVERMLNIMKTRSTMNPDIETINGLVQLAIDKNDAYLAERYIALGQKFRVRPNATTFILQMDYRIRAGDLSGAQTSYSLLQAEEVLQNEDLPVINKYIRALCATNNVPYDRIVSITTDLEERNARLEADTVSALCMMYLQRNELDEIMDILQVNTYHYTFAERARIRDAFLAFCLDRRNDVWRAWDAYGIICVIFDETDTHMRTRIMNEFFARKRSDMACHVFGHMRQHINPVRRPTLDTYIDCFVGIASCADAESLDMVHNMFKMDSAMEPNTRLYNSLMLAYTACDDASRSLHFWDDITNSREGPSYKSLEIVFQACQRKPFGDRPARDIWNKMRRMEIEITREVHAAYVGALAGQGKLDEVKGLVEVMEKEVGYGPDYLTIGTIYNAIQGSNRKDLVEEWAKELFPQAWKEIEKFGMTEHEEGHMVINMPERELKA